MSPSAVMPGVHPTPKIGYWRLKLKMLFRLFKLEATAKLNSQSKLKRTEAISVLCPGTCRLDCKVPRRKFLAGELPAVAQTALAVAVSLLPVVRPRLT